MCTSMAASATKLLCSLTLYGEDQECEADSSSITCTKDTGSILEETKKATKNTGAVLSDSVKQTVECIRGEEAESESVQSKKSAVGAVKSTPGAVHEESTPAVGAVKSTPAVGAVKSTPGAVHGESSKVLVHPINVGQGDAILLEIQYQDGYSEKHLIDGGKGQRTQNTQFYHNLTRSLQDNKCLSNNTVELDSIIITHPNTDHYGGINRLLADYTILCPITTTLASCLRVAAEGRSEMRKGEVFVSNETAQVRHWFSLTGEGENGRQHTYVQTLPKRSLAEITKNDELKFDGKQLNATSILTTVKLPSSKFDYDVVLTGDSYCSIIREKLALRGKSVGVFQVPHHGSKYNLNRHSSRAATVRELADFYSSFKADTYLISHGDHGSYNHPHSEVITGIITAAVENNQHCKIIVTATKFEESKIGEEIVKNWTKYVEIYHFKPDIPYVTLDPNVKTLPEGLQLYAKKVQAPISQEVKQTPPRKRISRDGNSFFNAVSRALANNTISPIQLREKLVEHLMQSQHLYHSRLGAFTLVQYQDLVSNYLLDGHSSPEIETLLPEAMAKTLEMRIQIVSTNLKENRIYGVPGAKTIQLMHDGGYYDYTPPTSHVATSAREHTPIRTNRPPQLTTDGLVGRRLLFPDDTATQKQTSSLKKVCSICKQQVTTSDYLYICKNTKCPVKTHDKCEEESRKTHRFVRNYKKCGYCRTCKECNVLMGTVHASCDLCGGAGHVPCIRATVGQTRDKYTCRVCREH